MATRGIAVREIECNLAVGNNGCDITYQIAITDPTMPPVYMGAIIDEVKVNLTNTDTLAQFETKLKNAINARAQQDGYTVTIFVIPTYKIV